jgi:hypothetical protein
MTSLTYPAIGHHSPHHHTRRQPPGRAKKLTLYTLLPACISAATVWGLFDIAQTADRAQPAPPVSIAQPVGVAQPDRAVQTVGQVVAFSPQSITTRSDDGTTTTFVITPATTRINTDGSANPVAAAAFTVNDTVTVVGVVDNGTPVATALSDESAAAGNGPPMDAV